jgi:hypothetical protein
LVSSDSGYRERDTNNDTRQVDAIDLPRVKVIDQGATKRHEVIAHGVDATQLPGTTKQAADDGK